VSLQKILVPTDFSRHSEEAVRTAKRLATAFGAELRLIHVTPPIQGASIPFELYVPDGLSEAWSSKARALLEEAYRALSDEGIEISKELIDDGSSVAEAVCGVCERWGADLVVMGTHGYSGIELGILGSTTEKTVGASSIPVLSVKAGHGWDRALRRILVPTDFSAESRRAVELAGVIAQAFEAEVDLLHVFELVPPAFLDIPIPDLDRDRMHEVARQEISSEMKALEERGVRVSFQVTTGDASREIVERAEGHDTDLIVMGTRGRTRFRKWLLGSVATRVVRFAECPVMTCGVKE
jgi:nucleotide-binding universal stress UspA family protein